MADRDLRAAPTLALHEADIAADRPAGPLQKSNKLDNVCYDIRGPVLSAANALEAAGHSVMKLNIGNPAPFGFDCPAEIIQDIAANLVQAQGYSDSKGLFQARKAIVQYYQTHGINESTVDNIYMGNGVSAVSYTHLTLPTICSV